MTAIAAPIVDSAPSLPLEALLRRFDVPGPRYTSYPTADRFSEFGLLDVQRAFASRLASPSHGEPLSVYVHIPFCESICYYCACNKIITKHHDRAAAYLDDLDAEIALLVATMGHRQVLSQLHFGGGSPTFLSDSELQRLLSSLHRAFDFAPDAELSIEVDPRTVTTDRLTALRAMGFNRISFGVQDFDPAVQKAVHRMQGFELVQGLLESARNLGFHSINADLIYGLPLQTPDSFARTISQITALKPDRIALYAYAHLPERFKAQRRILSNELPDAAQRLAMLVEAKKGFAAHGYTHIGMDHFALENDGLTQAKRAGSLQRNFQGYSTQPDCDMVALGVSAIGRIGGSYYQNAKSLADYHGQLQQGHLPVERGLVMSPDDALRRDVIMALMCQGRVALDAMQAKHGIVWQDYFAEEMARLASLADAGLVQLQDQVIQVTDIGWHLVRAVAMVFDRHLSAGQARLRFSKVV